ncbi:nuclear transport factor 2 family protein [Amycolatopsis sp. NPDC005232]|uniref:nuclear transport factor 2 family protein n=1 Tax=Amycolatopsis sp. NPDC005232 TaxID=3157027 RepID=UPI0033A95CD1
MYLDGHFRSQTSEDALKVLDTVARLLDTVARRDKEGMRALLVPGGVSVRSRDHEVQVIPFADFPDLLPGGTAELDERFHDPLVRVDDDIAMVWAHYDFLVDGVVHHWGTNILSLLKQSGEWRVSSIADNGRTKARPRAWDRAETMAP